MNSRIKFLLLTGFLCSQAFIQSCEFNPEGNATVKGKIYSVNLNEDGTVGGDTNKAVDVPVYLMAEKDTGQKMFEKTGKKGGYKFKNLSKGRYKLAVYSKSKVTQKQDSVIIRQFDITEDEQSFKMEKIVIYE